jgi:hypothetical protein
VQDDELPEQPTADAVQTDEDADPDAPWLRDDDQGAEGQSVAQQASGGDDVAQVAQGGDATEVGPTDDLTQQASGGDDVAQVAQGGNVTQVGPTDDVAQQASGGDDVAQVAQGGDATQIGATDDVAQADPAGAVTQVGPTDDGGVVTQSDPSQASSDPGYVSMDPVAVCHCAGCLRDGAEELRDVSRTVAPVAEEPALPDDVRATLVSALTALRALLETLAGELAEHGDELDGRASVLQDDDHAQAPGSLTSAARTLFGPDAWTAGSEQQDESSSQGALIDAAWGPGVDDSSSQSALIDAAWGPGVDDSSSQGALIDAASGPGVVDYTPTPTYGGLIDAASGGGVDTGGTVFSFGGGLPADPTVIGGFGGGGGSGGGTVVTIGDTNPGTNVLLPGLGDGAAYAAASGFGSTSLNNNLANLVVADYVTRTAGANVLATPGFTDFQVF